MKTSTIALAAIAFATITGTAAFAGDIDHTDQITATVSRATVIEARQAAPSANDQLLLTLAMNRDSDQH